MQAAHSFSPTPDNTRAFRDALGRFGTGVTVVTTRTEAGPVGVTANSFSSVSMDPPLVLWSPAKASRRFAHFAKAERFAIHVLAQDQAGVCFDFAKVPDAFEGLNWSESPHGVPLIEGCLSRFECRMSALHEAGDHAIVVGEVERASIAEGAPLLFFKGAVGEFLRRD